MIVVGPILALGWALGLGWQSRFSPPPRPPEIASPAGETRFKVRADPSAQGARTLQENQQAYELLGGGLAQSRMETTDLSRMDAIRHYDREQSEDGWRFDPVLTAEMDSVDATNTFRAYTKEGRIRIVIIGTPVSESDATRAVTVFEGQFRASED